MKEVTREWILRAEEDYRVAKRESRVQDEPSYSAVSFHAQQCAEKYLKAFMQEHEVTLTKTHDLVYLLEQVLSIKPLWSVYRNALEHLVDFAVEARYPGSTITKEQALEALSIATEIRSVIKEELQYI
jgi:HEPN domain-containing protein